MVLVVAFVMALEVIFTVALEMVVLTVVFVMWW